MKCPIVGMLSGQVPMLRSAEWIRSESVVILALGWHLSFRTGRSTKGPSLGREVVWYESQARALQAWSRVPMGTADIRARSFSGVGGVLGTVRSLAASLAPPV